MNDLGQDMDQFFQTTQHTPVPRHLLQHYNNFFASIPLAPPFIPPLAPALYNGQDLKMEDTPFRELEVPLADQAAFHNLATPPNQHRPWANASGARPPTIEPELPFLPLPQAQPLGPAVDAGMAGVPSDEPSTNGHDPDHAEVRGDARAAGDQDDDDDDEVQFLGITGVDSRAQRRGDGGFTGPVRAEPSAAPVEVVDLDPELTYESCLAAVLEVLPEISRDYVRRMWDKTQEESAVNIHARNAMPEQFIGEIIDAGRYPKEADKVKERKRKRAMYANSDEEEAAEFKDREGLSSSYGKAALTMLQNEFPYIPKNYIVTQFKEHGRLFKTFFVLENAERNHANSPSPYRRHKTPRRPDPLIGTDSPRSNPGTPLGDGRTLRENGPVLQLSGGMPEARGYGLESLRKELAAARRQSKKKEDERMSKEAEDAADKAEDEKEIKEGKVDECPSCYDGDVPLRKMVECRRGHKICLGCLKSYAHNLIGENAPKLTCATGEDCEVGYLRQYLLAALGEKALGRLEFINQQASLADAGLDDLEECPFCDFKAIVPDSKERNKEFRCYNSDCEAISCRICRKATHIPMTCDEAKTEEGADERHLIEEAMTEAMKRACPGCKNPIMKVSGCNHMHCRCGTHFCDHCGKQLPRTNPYSHFSSGPTGRGCPIQEKYDGERAEKQAAAAEQAARAKLKKDNPELTEEQLNVSARINKNVPVPSQHHQRYGPHWGRGAIGGEYAYDFIRAGPGRWDVGPQVDARFHGAVDMLPPHVRGERYPGAGAALPPLPWPPQPPQVDRANERPPPPGAAPHDPYAGRLRPPAAAEARPAAQQRRPPPLAGRAFDFNDMTARRQPARDIYHPDTPDDLWDGWNNLDLDLDEDFEDESFEDYIPPPALWYHERHGPMR